ncbi:hypothetical protein UFOVP1058_60 [uncultured Caudovirales phage]|uniref:Uncharacterized protein n=1 Tax=uncultured Caudovirales phage TaxID=2100421 RepID=A0A6J5NKE6_9CAUD|nr:hypothetical protein UFOVP656_20 [uncultured Caudovirales phage]CAB4167708.1 hypothetical protein UFOVP857_42 [uncultured Caudovirales phage]CAB4168352.1 hypothetical protein UFOVP879_4 [uncultured Caudovirales phage]CAB4181731.1 hypothetical protein UFOVP1058_60 [uncultured Caudovirales phage]CAB4195340.1 hypothetical protein UFOVP1289_15 [uncultured Caudovirales phage]
MTSLNNIGHNSGERVDLKAVTGEAIASYVRDSIAASGSLAALSAAMTAELGAWYAFIFYASNKRTNGAWRATAKLARFHTIVDSIYAAYAAQGKTNPSVALRALRDYAEKTAKAEAVAATKAKVEAKLSKLTPKARIAAEAKIAAATPAKPTKGQRHMAMVRKQVASLYKSVDGEKSTALYMLIGCALAPMIKVDATAETILSEMVANLSTLQDDLAKAKTKRSSK